MTYAIERLFDKIKKEGFEKGIEEEKIKIAKNLLDVLNDDVIAVKIGISIEKVKELRNELSN